MSILTEMSASLQKGKANDVKEMVKTALSDGVPAKQILEEGLLSGMSIVGVKFKNNEVFVPEVLIAARAMNAGMEILKPALSSDDMGGKGKAVVGTVKGDLHDIGKNLVIIMFEGKGIEVIDVGTDVAPEVFVETAIREQANIIACSALLTTTMAAMKAVVDMVEEKGVKGKIKVMVGGAPVTQGFCDTIGADYYASDAATASEGAVMLSQK